MRLVFYPSYQEYRLSNLLQSAEHHLDLLPCLSKSIKGFVGYSVIFALVSCLLGVYLPIHFDISIPSSGAIIMISSFIFIVTVIIKMLFKNFAEGE